MESQNIDERIEREARRVAAAFDVEEWKLSTSTTHVYDFASVGNKPSISWSLFYAPIFIEWIMVGQQNEPDYCLAINEDDGWKLVRSSLGPAAPQYATLMARGFYRLGDNCGVLSEQLPSLSAHEKLELRLSLPREFWPQSWLNEETLKDGR